MHDGAKFIVDRADELLLVYRRFWLPPQETYAGGKHTQGHATIFIAGSGTVHSAGKTKTVQDRDFLYIPAEVTHSFLAGDSGLGWLCIFIKPEAYTQNPANNQPFWDHVDG